MQRRCEQVWFHISALVYNHFSSLHRHVLRSLHLPVEIILLFVSITNSRSLSISRSLVPLQRWSFDSDAFSCCLAIQKFMEGFVWIYVMMQQTWWWSSYTHSLPISFGTKIWELLTNRKETKKQQKQQQRRIEMHQIEKWENDACWNSKTQNQQHQPKWACLFSLLFSTYVYFIRPPFWIDQFLVLWFSFLVVALRFYVLRATFLYKKRKDESVFSCFLFVPENCRI